MPRFDLSLALLALTLCTGQMTSAGESDSIPLDHQLPDNAVIKGRLASAEKTVLVYLDHSYNKTLFVINPDTQQVVYQYRHKGPFRATRQVVFAETKVLSTERGELLHELKGKVRLACGSDRYVVLRDKGTSASALEGFEGASKKARWKLELPEIGQRNAYWMVSPLLDGYAVYAMARFGTQRKNGLGKILKVNFKGKVLYERDFTPQAQKAKSPFGVVWFNEKSKSRLAVYMPDASDKKGREGLMIRFLKGKKSIFAPGASSVIYHGHWNELRRGKQTFGIVGHGSKGNSQVELQPVDLKKNRVVKKVRYPGPLPVSHIEGYGVSGGKLRDLFTGEELSNLDPLEKNEKGVEEEGTLAFTTGHLVQWSSAKGLATYPCTGGAATRLELKSSEVRLWGTGLLSEWVVLQVKTDQGHDLVAFQPQTQEFKPLKSFSGEVAVAALLPSAGRVFVLAVAKVGMTFSGAELLSFPVK